LRATLRKRAPLSEGVEQADKQEIKKD
jgi:hypothetical protein